MDQEKKSRTKTPRQTSPYALVQEILRDEPWKLLVAVILLNQTSARQAIPVLQNFLSIWSSPEEASQAIPELVANVLRPVGLHNRRAKYIVDMSRSFLNGFIEPEDLPGIGKYGADSYNMFVRGYLVEDVLDKELKNYVKWAKEREPEPEAVDPLLREDPLTLGQAGALRQKGERQGKGERQEASKAVRRGGQRIVRVRASDGTVPTPVQRRG